MLLLFTFISCGHFLFIYFLAISIFLNASGFHARFSTLLFAAAAKSHQLCPTLCDPTDSSPPGSPVPGILQARSLEWVAISFSNAWKWKVKVKSLSHVQLLATPWTAAYQAPLSVGVSRQEYWSGVLLPSLYMTTGKTIALTRRTFVGKVISLLSNMLDRKSVV